MFSEEQLNRALSKLHAEQDALQEAWRLHHETYGYGMVSSEQEYNRAQIRSKMDALDRRRELLESLLFVATA